MTEERTCKRRNLNVTNIWGELPHSSDREEGKKEETFGCIQFAENTLQAHAMLASCRVFDRLIIKYTYIQYMGAVPSC